MKGFKFSITLVQYCTVWPTFLTALILDSFTPLQTYRLRQNEGLQFSITLVQNCTVWPTFLAALILDSFIPLQTVQIIFYLQAHTHLHYTIEARKLFNYFNDWRDYNIRVLFFIFIVKKSTILFISRSL